MRKFEVKIWVSESRYYTVEAEDEEQAVDLASTQEPSFVKEHDMEVEVTACD